MAILFSTSPNRREKEAAKGIQAIWTFLENNI